METLNATLKRLGLRKTGRKRGSATRRHEIEGIGWVTAAECWAWLREKGLIR